MEKKKDSFFSNLKSVGIAVFIALLIRSFIAEPFNIPSGSMKPNLLEGDFIFVSKWSYGYSRHSLPFSIGWSDSKFFSKKPQRGDVVVFKTPEDNRTDYIKRVIGLPGDEIVIKDGLIIINNKIIYREKMIDFIDYKKDIPNNEKRVRKYKEFFFDKEVNVLDVEDGSFGDNRGPFIVESNHFFVMGDNRDRSQDSRFPIVKQIPFENLVGKARFIFFSLENSRFLEIWKWPNAIRGSRIFTTIK